MDTKKHSSRSVMLMLLLITVAAFIIRILFFNENPPALNQDEAMNGYNAFSLSRNFRDSWGFFFPSLMHGFGNVDFRSPLYAYMSIPFVKIMGLSETSTRAAALVFNTALVPLTFILVKRLTKDITVSLISAAILAITPWSIHYSRIGHEAVLSPFFYTALIILLHKIFNDEKCGIGTYILTGAIFGLSIYTYQVARMLSPLIVAFMCLVYFRKALKNFFKLLVSGITGLIIIFPMIYSSIINPGNLESRFEQVSIFSFPGIPKNFVLNYFSHFSPDFLFLRGDNGNLPASDGRYGMLALCIIPFIIPGVWRLVYLIIKSKENNSSPDSRKNAILLAGFLLLFPLPSALTFPAPHSLRAYTLIPILCIIPAMGVYQVYIWLTRLKVQKYIIPATAAVVILFTTATTFTFLNRYYRHYPVETEEYYQYGLKQAMEYLNEVKDNYKEIYITDWINQPFVYVLFYTSYDPVKYQQIEKDADLSSFGFVRAFDKYRFMNPADMPVDSKEALFITEGNVTIKGRNPVKTINGSNGDLLFIIWN